MMILLLQDARQKIESDERLQAAVRDAEDLLARIDDQLLPIESLLADASSSREDLVHVCQDRLPTADRLIEELHKRLDSEEEHASELHSISDRAAAARRQFVEADRTVQLRLREMDDEQRLIDHITQQLQDAETVLDNLSTSDLHPQPLEQAVQDRNLLAVLLEQLHSIDLPAIRNAKNRTLLQERVAKVGERVQVSWPKFYMQNATHLSCLV